MGGGGGGWERAENKDWLEPINKLNIGAGDSILWFSGLERNNFSESYSCKFIMETPEV